MKRGFLTFLSALVVMAAGPFLLFAATYLLTWRSYPVKATVETDSNLPRVVLKQMTLHAETFGPPQAPVLVVLHDGPGADYRSLLPLKSLSDQFRVVFYDQRGSGLSARVPENKLSVQQALEELEALVDHISPDQAVSFFGHGWGGMLATAYAGRHPQRTASLILAEPGFLNTEMAHKILPELSRTSAGFIFNTTLSWIKSLHIQEPDREAAADFVYSQIRVQPRYHCPQKLPTAESYWRGGFKAWKTITQSTFTKQGQIAIDFIKDPKSFQKPVLFLISECNTLTGKTFQNHQMRLFQQVKKAEIKHSGHEFLLDNPQATLAQVRSFLNPSEQKPELK
ncbi:hypothetical protein COW36_12450 [bacterium (Candidatus Blackallbacteria) CG17_big_fil_post_rev_8_21_14_2_50_48_46]|uniref:AB hydrolase-1 domain-containing protein n=1 Tax=bacterium (Candidatus Blackallbacteria) CG17_big_fil_post_rev_8_21_14_2_50_48_46 TaxID=2014261 RepID=A0A2M7G492_9BACT|nr:MAG: hypothetical protein COW64_02810 [bacterium (Candidatus Blackallbacteria) CG18_big_fil_WC_8_21_14_2_50_49_26]PIW16571.1 MAG: hypothetical protein COW36_12450 [bacterium (Candidatus Blackallbacteria) CG17_big_fil_post_rev_8_21_14_2_50_48_46]PIW46079.1 MAG: hypothetical protein COW20_17715 [bacterium (Candidatus Blackallbacteria) CG13_big_fil_rev_8_21_14_2_50_49_14]